MKKSFSLIELMIVIAISSLILLVVTNFLIMTVQQNNKISIENEIRNEANTLLDQMAKDIRQSKCECVTATSIRLYGVSNCGACNGTVPTPYAAYSVNASNDFLKNSVVKNSAGIKARSCADCGCLVPTPGLIVAAAGRAYTVNLSFTQAGNSPRSDFCGKVTVQQTVKPRN